MSAYTDAERFLQEVFGSDWREKAFLCNSGDWRRKKLEDLDLTLDCYFCVGAIPWGKGRKAENVEDVRTLVIDDVCTKVDLETVEGCLGAATATTATSIGNFQWAYKLAKPITPDAWRGIFDNIEQLLFLFDEPGKKLDGRDAAHLFRLPIGHNTKPGKGEQVVQVDLRPKLMLDVVDILPLPKPSKPVTSGEGAEIKLDRSKLESLMRMVPNDMERDGWIEVGHGLKALCEDDEDGFAVFDYWSMQHPSYDAAKTRIAWDSFGASGLRTEGGQLRAMAEQLNPTGFAAWVFDDGAEPPEITPGPKSAPHVLASGEFVEGFIPPDYLVKKLITKAFLYSLTGQTGAGKTSITLRLAATVALGRSFGGLDTKPCRVLYLAAENPVDIQMRWIALAAEMEFDVNSIPVFFVKGGFRISATMKELRAEALRVGGEFGLVVVDTGPVFFEGEDENDRVAMRRHARIMRELIEVIPGKPVVIVNVHPTKNATADDLRPSGGGSFLNEVDGNLTAAKNEDQTIELGWQGKWRGVEFAPLHFRLKTVTHPRLVDSDGDPMPTIVCEQLSMSDKEEMERKEFVDQDKLLDAMERNPRISAVELAIYMDWYYPGGSPAKSKVQRYVKTLIKQKLVKKDRQSWIVAGAIKAKSNGSDRTGPDLTKPAGPKKH